MTAWLILNPRSARGRTGQRAATLLGMARDRLGPVEARRTEAPMHAAQLAREAVEAGATRVIAVGGDGTISEVVNGLMSVRGAQPSVALGVLAQGTGGDFRRSLALPRDLDAQFEILTGGRTAAIDVGRLSFTADSGGPGQRFFINTASAGMSGDVCDRVNRMRWTKRLGGRVAFNVASLQALASYPNPRVRLSIDGGPAETRIANTVAVCNGAYFGGGMHVAPAARLDDGRFDVVVLGDLRWFESVRAMPALYRGAHLDHPKVSHVRASKIRIEPADDAPLRLEVDGEAPGRAPVDFELLGAALPVIVPPAFGPSEVT